MIKKFAEFIEESYGNRTPDEIAEMDKLAIRYFGTTKSFKLGGYVMRDGTILDFSESNQGSDGNTDKIISDIEEPDIWEYLDLGNIRINYPSGFDLAQPMTPEQKMVMRLYIQECSRVSRNGFYVTIFKEGKTQEYFEYDKAYVDTVMRDINNYFNNASN